MYGIFMPMRVHWRIAPPRLGSRVALSMEIFKGRRVALSMEIFKGRRVALSMEIFKGRRRRLPEAGADPQADPRLRPSPMLVKRTET